MNLNSRFFIFCLNLNIKKGKCVHIGKEIKKINS